MKKILTYFLFIAVVLCGLNSCVETRETAQSLRDRFPGARLHALQDSDYELGYMSIHRNDTFPTLFFIHGSPSNMSVYNAYYADTSLAKWANIIAADRPGYGFSNSGKSEKSVRRQAKQMWNILEKEGYPSPLYIIGSSYGGTVATKMAMTKPDKVAGLVLVSASLAPGEETTYDISYIIRHKFFRWLLPQKIMVANDEKLSHIESLNEMLPMWSKITAPVILFQGTKDRLILPENVNFARLKLTKAKSIEYHMLENERHFLQIKYKNYILERLRALVKKNAESEKQLAGNISLQFTE
ncbi:MAG: alpha/beta hydrolase [Lentimicrobium sp.]|jgi:pimeloyl-ACP methyl ester carboxylesterase|nr:alpha/beta hydrolase [Lentimicrobium sp.]